ncbi:MAG: ADP-ribosylation factor-like protein [Promethearchaeota archaeon]
MEYLKEEEKEFKKILFTGLDTAGKTSIILTLQREFSKIAYIEPTRGAQRRIFKFLGKNISEWDLGGQISYRISYLRNPGKHFDGTEIAIYVIDIRNLDRMFESISYLCDVVKQFKILKINPSINIFFHKYDPILIKNAQNEMDGLIIELTKRIKDTINYKKLHFFKTSIYNLSTILSAMSEILLELYPKAKLIEKTVKQFAKKLNSDGLIVIDNNTLVVGAYCLNQETKNTLMKSIPLFMALKDGLYGDIPSQPGDQIVVYRYGKYILFKQIMLEESIIPYYLLLIRKDNPWDLYFTNKDYDSFFKMMKTLFFK